MELMPIRLLKPYQPGSKLQIRVCRMWVTKSIGHDPQPTGLDCVIVDKQGKLLYILDGDNVRHGLNCTLVLKQNIVQRTFEGLVVCEPLVKKMGPNSKLHFSSLKIRRKHFLSSIFQHLRSC
ncbi:unnamed protein product [Malus baccata var. baccata]